jgi:acyl-coenzyme A thioesterase PaaI-like protein
MTKSLQDHFAPLSACFGCGPTNQDGLQIKSFLEGDEVVARWQPKRLHEAFAGILSGGIIGALLDCHCNWAAAHHLMQSSSATAAPCTVTAEYTIKMRRPTPTAGLVTLRAKLVEVTGDRAKITGTLEAGGKVCASCDGLFVAVREGHPAFHRW